jgi:hypothetical protein
MPDLVVGHFGRVLVLGKELAKCAPQNQSLLFRTNKRILRALALLSLQFREWSSDRAEKQAGRRQMNDTPNGARSAHLHNKAECVMSPSDNAFVCLLTVSGGRGVPKKKRANRGTEVDCFYYFSPKTFAGFLMFICLCVVYLLLLHIHRQRAYTFQAGYC